ncbi:hypothetical protein NBRC116592_09880 [Colwellia sp. KU-HH00111]|uniref:alpha/beta hydrolase family esterase n=1 Tax=Colwellia sp. KU-HH00111 TaxID=3127652 RepID=UPI00310AE44F
MDTTKMNTYFNKNIKTVWISIITTILLSACGGGNEAEENRCAGRALATGNECITLSDREVIVHKPSSQTIDGIALFLHGAPGDARKVMNIFDAEMIADKYNLLALSPHGNKGTWGWLSNNNEANGNSDIDYLNQLLTKVTGDYGIISDKLYIFGYSAGGFMAYKLACVIPEKISAIVSLAGQFRGDLDICSTSTSVDIHHFHSEADQEVPFSGRTIGNILSVPDTIEHWRQKNGCDETFEAVAHEGVTQSSAGTTTEFYNNCVKTLALSKMNNVAHESSYLPEKLHDIYSYLLTE